MVLLYVDNAVHLPPKKGDADKLIKELKVIEIGWLGAGLDSQASIL